MEPRPPGVVDETDARLYRRSLFVFAALLALLVVTTILLTLRSGGGELELVRALSVAGVAFAAVAYRRAMTDLAERRSAREASFGRILQGLSRSTSPESIVDAIVNELLRTTGADHVVVARRREPDGGLEARLVSANPLAAPSTTLLAEDASTVVGNGTRDGSDRAASSTNPLAAGAAADRNGIRAAEEVARRLRSAYGLSNTLPVPLVADGRVVGALVLSRRPHEAWNDETRRLLDWAGREVSVALERAYAHEAAEAGANIDALTRLPNRRFFDELSRLLVQRRRAGDALGVLMVDVDRFKGLNDRYGHSAGDRVLKLVAQAIAETVRGDDTPVRYGGEEFAVLLKQTGQAQAAEVGERIRQAVRAIPLDDLGTEESVSVSVGVAVGEPGSGSLASLVEEADRALYLAKRRGRDRVEVA